MDGIATKADIQNAMLELERFKNDLCTLRAVSPNLARMSWTLTSEDCNLFSLHEMLVSPNQMFAKASNFDDFKKKVEDRLWETVKSGILKVVGAKHFLGVHNFLASGGGDSSVEAFNKMLADKPPQADMSTVEAAVVTGRSFVATV